MKKKPKTRLSISKQLELDLKAIFNSAIKVALNGALDKVMNKKKTVPEEGHESFIVACNRVACYTTIGADNMHHASNKATKLFGPGWTSVRLKTDSVLFKLAREEYQFLDVKKFGQIVRP
jgi:hypothetical protein